MNFDIAFVGHYTKDTIVTPQETRTVHGGAFRYGAYVVAKMGLKAAVVTRLAREDFEVVEDLTRLGVEVFAKPTAQSTRLRLVYPTADLDQRSISIESYAGAFTLAEVAPVQARVFHIGASIRGEVPSEVIEALAQKWGRISLDVQGFIRINQDGKLVHANWPEEARVLKLVDVLKTDGVEAQTLTGKKDIKEAAKILADFGPREIVVTHRDGVLVYAEGCFYEAPFFPREVRGRTGRGDTCTAAYLGKRLTAPSAEATLVDTLSGANFQKYWQETLIPQIEADLGIKVNYLTSGASEQIERMKAWEAGQGDVHLLAVRPGHIPDALEQGIELETLYPDKLDVIPNLGKCPRNYLMEVLGENIDGRGGSTGGASTP